MTENPVENYGNIRALIHIYFLFIYFLDSFISQLNERFIKHK